MIGRIFNNTKWQLLFYFVLTGMFAVILYYIGDYAGYFVISNQEASASLIAIVLFLSLIVGYIAVQRFLRKLDLLHLNILQVGKGNLTVRMPQTDDHTFASVYHEFNEMMAAMEHKMKILQRLGESEVMEHEKAAETAVLEERRRLARDLHDSVSQQLFAIHMSASALPKVLENNKDQADLVINQLIQMSNLAQKQMRALIAQLRPIELEGKTLGEALEQWFPDYCRQNGLKGIKEIELKGKLTEAKEHQLFLIIQEAMANIVKHAGAHMVSLSLIEGHNQAVLSISDDGKGFNSSLSKQGSYGLSTMRERAEKLGGHAEVISKPGAGTTIRIHIPIFNELKRGESDV
ncbi:sensor histidine kinase [Paenibacillus sediminis]|uniref:Oxygen sensor histidine kinase NreB n=1 Tax=Paenibacillus sediminis TaxID=664909 RepID=A0ABS4H7X1_9BACL|nr:sensor histidine kinase [Paenibacillus sediminis]MBP1938629.1 signal transduction histidine kinase [Paenibacillus sediminis]